MVRLLRAVPELLFLVKGIVAATRSVIFTLALLLILLYVFAIALRQLTDGSPVGESRFTTVPSSMYTLLIDACLMDSLGTLVRALEKDNLLGVLVFWIFVLLSSCTVMNMLIGVVCEVVSSVASTEKEALMVDLVRTHIKPLFDMVDESGDSNGLISKDEFLGILNNERAVELLEDVGVDVLFLVDQSDTIFQEEWTSIAGASGSPAATRELTFEDLMEIIMELRGSNFATVKHIVELRRHLLSALTQTHQTLMQIEECVKGANEVADKTNFQRHTSPQLTFLKRVEAPKQSPSIPSETRSYLPAPPLADADRKEGFTQTVLSFSPNSNNVLLPFAAPLDSSCLPQHSCDTSIGADLFMDPPKTGPQAIRTKGWCVPQPQGNSALPEHFASDRDLNCLLERLECVACEALCRVHQEFLDSISKTVTEVARERVEESNVAVHIAANGSDDIASSWPVEGTGLQPTCQEPRVLGPLGSRIAAL